MKYLLRLIAAGLLIWAIAPLELPKNRRAPESDTLIYAAAVKRDHPTSQSVLALDKALPELMREYDSRLNDKKGLQTTLFLTQIGVAGLCIAFSIWLSRKGFVA